MSPKSHFLIMAGVLVIAISAVLATIPGSAKADRLEIPPFHLECQHYRVCQDV